MAATMECRQADGFAVPHSHVVGGGVERARATPPMDGPYRAADGSACCDIADCFKAAVTVLSNPTEEMVRVLVSTVEDTQHQQVWVQTVVVVPGRSIYRSEDAQSWYCTRAHFQSWNTLGETTSQPCATVAGYRIISPCVRCIFVNVGA
jgi:hypothetical protein